MTRSWAIPLAALAALLAAHPAHARDLTVSGFGGAAQDAQRKAFFEPFEKATGTKLAEDTYDGGLAKIKAMVDSKAVIWDVVDVEGSDLARGCEAGYFEKFDPKPLGDMSQWLPAATFSDCGIGQFVWSTILAYNGDKLQNGPKSWADFFDTTNFPGKRALRRGAKFTLEIALMADGVAPGEVYQALGTPAGVDRAFKKLDTIKSSIQWWEAGAQPPEWLSSGDVVMTSAYNGRIAAMNAGGKHLQIVWNGQIYSLDYWTVVKGSPFTKQATQMIDFMSQPDVLKNFAQYIPYGPPQQQAVAMLPASMVEQLPTAPAHMTNALSSSNNFWLENEDDLNQRFNAWLAR